MHELVSYNRAIIRSEDASMSPVAVSGLYGKGVFTTLAVMEGKPFLFEKHWARLNDNAGRLGIDLEDFSESELASALEELLSANSVEKGRCRITVFDSSSSGIWRSLTDRKCSVLIQSADPRERPEQFSVDMSPFVVSSSAPLNNIKSCNYLEQTVSYDAAYKAGFDEAIRINEKNEIVSACISNIFWIRDRKLFTPAKATGCLEGTTRAYVMERCEVEKAHSTIDEVTHADSIFLTSAGLGIAAVGKVSLPTGDLTFKPPGKKFFDDNGLVRLLTIQP